MNYYCLSKEKFFSSHLPNIMYEVLFRVKERKTSSLCASYFGCGFLTSWDTKISYIGMYIDLITKVNKLPRGFWYFMGDILSVSFLHKKTFISL